MKYIRQDKTIVIPQDVKVEIKSRRVTVTGNGFTKQLAALRTVCSHIDNMITGVTKKYRYAMRMVYAHFPITCAIVNGGKRVEIRNFLGEKIVRSIDMLGESKAYKSEATKDEIHIEGNDID